MRIWIVVDIKSTETFLQTNYYRACMTESEEKNKLPAFSTICDADRSEEESDGDDSVFSFGSESMSK